MKCPKCNSERATKNGRRRGKQCYKCLDCGRQLVESPIERSYPSEVRQLCLKMYLNGMGLRGIERVTEIHHTTVINWLKEAGIKLPDAPEGEEIPEITEIDELQTFIGNKKNKVWVWTVVNHWKPGILLWTVGERSSTSFQIIWTIIRCWHSFWYVTDGWKVEPGFIEQLRSPSRQNLYDKSGGGKYQTQALLSSSSSETKITKSTKTDVIRIFKIQSYTRLINLLERMKTQNFAPDDYVFTTLSGKQYNRLNLSALWLGLDKSKKGNKYYYPGVVTRLMQDGEVSQYLKPSATRHTFITIQAHAGVDLKLLADSVGNSVDVIYDHYLGVNKDAAFFDI